LAWRGTVKTNSFNHERGEIVENVPHLSRRREKHAECWELRVKGGGNSPHIKGENSGKRSACFHTTEGTTLGREEKR